MNKKSNKKFKNIKDLESEIEDQSFQKKVVDDSVNFTKQSFMLMVASALVLVIVLLWGVYFFASRSSEQSDNQKTVEVSQVQRSVSGKTVEEDKKDALASAQSIFVEANKSNGGLDVQQRILALDDGDSSDVSEGLKKKIRFEDAFKTDEELQNTTYQALIILSTYLNSDDIAPVSEDIWQEVYLDQEAGIAYVPVSAFYPEGASFSLELVYIDGDWKLSPYGLLNVINLSAALQEQKDAVVPSVPEGE